MVVLTANKNMFLYNGNVFVTEVSLPNDIDSSVWKMVTLEERELIEEELKNLNETENYALSNKQHNFDGSFEDSSFED